MSISVCIDGVWRPLSRTRKVVINLYRYGVLYQTYNVNAGESFTLPAVPTVQPDDTEHYGWTKTAGSTSRTYTPTGSFTPTTDTNLYAVYKYTGLGQVTQSFSGGTSGNGVSTSLTVSYAGNVTIKAWHNESHNDNYNNNYTSTSSAIVLSSNSTVQVTINGSYVTSTTSNVVGTDGNKCTSITKTVSAGDVIALTLAVGQSSSGAGPTYNWSHSSTNHASITYPGNVTSYRSSI